MKMIINNKMLSIPPHVSVAWKTVASLHVEFRLSTPVLLIGLINGSIIEIPNLDASAIDTIFTAHAKYMDQEQSNPNQKILNRGLFSLSNNLGFTDSNFKMDIFSPNGEIRMENMEGILQHNPEQANTPDLPLDFLQKIGGIAKIVTIDENLLPKPEPHCNCLHCQIAKTIQKSLSEEVPQETPPTEEVTEADLKFKEWDIFKSDDKLYTVKNPLDVNETYTVYLGTPIGCTCGHSDCDHLKAVLRD